MSTWTSSPRRAPGRRPGRFAGALRRIGLPAAILAGAVALTGCAALMAQQSMSVAGGNVVVAGPAGFCIDPQASHDTPSGPFVLLGSCDSITGSNAASGQPPAIRAVLTAAVSAGNTGASVASNQKSLAAFFRSTAGRKVLSRADDARTVRVLSEGMRSGVFVMHLRDTSRFQGQAVSPDYWRALFDLNGRIVTLSVIGVPAAPFPDRTALSTLMSFVASVRAASPAQATATTAATTAAPAAAPAGKAVTKS